MGASGQSQGTQFERTIEDAERDTQVARYKVGRTYRQVAEHFNISVSAAHDAVQRAIATVPIAAGRDVIADELIKIDALEEAAWLVLRANHIHISDGRVVKDDGTAITDHKPVLMAIDRVVKCQERRAKLLGLDAPVRQEVHVTDATDTAIQQLVSELAVFDTSAEAGAAREAES